MAGGNVFLPFGVLPVVYFFCNRRWAAAADAVTNGRPAVVAAGQFNRSLSA